MAYVTADASCSSKHVHQPVGNNVDYWPLCWNYSLNDCVLSMTIARLCVSTYLGDFLVDFGEIVSSD